jgi:hypothetical protein
MMGRMMLAGFSFVYTAELTTSRMLTIAVDGPGLDRRAPE